MKDKAGRPLSKADQAELKRMNDESAKAAADRAARLKAAAQAAKRRSL